tara:strand:+ start:8184 stop:8624 length:441 start_codon:yes stop_codon:yes gene_type:complete
LLSYRSPECIGGCEGCVYKQYPYEAQVPLKIDGKYPYLTFTKDEDVQGIIDKLIAEVKQVNIEKGKSFNIAEAIFGQLPFFACKRFLYSVSAQQDINKYSYCSQFNVPAYEGHYGKHPKKWIDKSFYIKGIIQKQQEKDGEKQSRQ